MSICGADCTQCPLHTACAGCTETDGCPFGEPCMVAAQCKNGTLDTFKQKLIDAFGAVGVEVTELFPLKGSFINMTYTLPGGQVTQFWNDNKIYLGNQLPKSGTDRCYGIAADDTYLMVCKYGQNGADAQLVLFKRWNDHGQG